MHCSNFTKICLASGTRGISECVMKQPCIMMLFWTTGNVPFLYGCWYSSSFHWVLIITMHQTDLKCWSFTRCYIIVLLQALEFVNTEELNQKPILIHGFSAGGYLYSETMKKILDQPEQYGKYQRTWCSFSIWGNSGPLSGQKVIYFVHCITKFSNNKIHSYPMKC